MSTEDIERATQDHEAALSTLFHEFDNLTDKELGRLDRRYAHLTAALERAKDTRRVFFDVVFTEARARLDRERDENENLVAMAQILDDHGEYVWWVFPEVNGHMFEEDHVTFFKTRHDSRLLIRSMPRDWVGEVRNVPKDHPLALAAPEWTTTNQGQPSWSDELATLEPQIQHLAESNGIAPGLVRAYVASEGEMPEQDWYEMAKTANLQVPEVSAASDAE